MQKAITLLVAALLAFGIYSCSTEPSSPREISGHTQLIQGISHGAGAFRAERYCTQCHGPNLVGGTSNQPSCFKCHGKTWSDTEWSVSSAPADHTTFNVVTGGLVNGFEHAGFRHHPGLTSPVGTCDSCHGADLGGDFTLGSSKPSCFLCHVKKW